MGDTGVSSGVFYKKSAFFQAERAVGESWHLHGDVWAGCAAVVYNLHCIDTDQQKSDKSPFTQTTCMLIVISH